MDTLFAQLLIPILALITLVFLYASFLLTRISKKQRDHYQSTQQNFKYTAQAIDRVGVDVQEIHGTLGKTLLPKIDQVYEQVTRGREKLAPERVLEILRGLGMSGAKPLNEDSTAIFGGVRDETGRKITLLVNILKEGYAIDVLTFSVFIESLQPQLARKLLELNSGIRIGKFALRYAGDKTIVTLEHSFHSTHNSIDPDDFKAGIMMMLSTYRQLFERLSEENATFSELLIDEYARLLAESGVKK